MDENICVFCGQETEDKCEHCNIAVCKPICFQVNFCFKTIDIEILDEQ